MRNSADHGRTGEEFKPAIEETVLPYRGSGVVCAQKNVSVRISK
jgi:hypothetical protein